MAVGVEQRRGGDRWRRQATHHLNRGRCVVAGGVQNHEVWLLKQNLLQQGLRFRCTVQREIKPATASGNMAQWASGAGASAHRCSADSELLSSISVFTLWNESSPPGCASAALKHSAAWKWSPKRLCAHPIVRWQVHSRAEGSERGLALSTAARRSAMCLARRVSLEARAPTMPAGQLGSRGDETAMRDVGTSTDLLHKPEQHPAACRGRKRALAE